MERLADRTRKRGVLLVEERVRVLDVLVGVLLDDDDVGLDASLPLAV